MRYLISVSLLFICSVMYAQSKKELVLQSKIQNEFEEMKKNFKESPEEWIFQKTVVVDGKSKDELYTAAIEALSSLYKDAKDVIQNKDKEIGIIIGKGVIDSSIRKVDWITLSRNRCWHMIKIETKDNRYRITLTISTIWVEYGADLRHPFNGTEFKIYAFYPYWEECKYKQWESSFENLRFAYDSSFLLIEQFEKGVHDALLNDSDW